MSDLPGRQMGRAAALMMGSVLLSRILGYARDAVIASQHGSTPEADAYFETYKWYPQRAGRPDLVEPEAERTSANRDPNTRQAIAARAV